MKPLYGVALGLVVIALYAKAGDGSGNLPLVEICKFPHPLLECRSITRVVPGPVDT